jgi:hypothetical protein
MALCIKVIRREVFMDGYAVYMEGAGETFIKNVVRTPEKKAK